MSSSGRPLASSSAPAIESSARRALVPETKMKSPARRKCGKVPRGCALPATTPLGALASLRRSSILMRALLELDADVHRLGKERERMCPALAADTRELHPAEGRAQVAQKPVVHPGDAHLHLARHAMRALQVAGPDGRRQTVAGVVGERDRLLLGVE